MPGFLVSTHSVAVKIFVDPIRLPSDHLYCSFGAPTEVTGQQETHRETDT